MSSSGPWRRIQPNLRQVKIEAGVPVVFRHGECSLGIDVL